MRTEGPTRRHAWRFPRRPWLPAVLLLAGVLALPASPGLPSPAWAEEGAEDAPSREEAPAADTTALELQGTATFKTLGSLGQEDFRFTLEIRNPTDAPLKILKGNLLLAHRGGWLAPLDPDSLDGSFFRGTLTIPAAETVPGASSKYRSVTPATHTLLTVQAEDGSALLATPIVREEFPVPTAYEPPTPFGVGLVGPLEVLPFSDGEDSILLMGQHQVLDGRQPSDVETSIVVANDSGAVDPITWTGLDARGDLTTLWPFVRRVPVFDGFAKGRVQVRSTAVLDGKAVTFSRTWPVERVEPTPVLSPVTGTWQLSNGPGRKDISPQAALPQYRYAYDMVVLKRGRTHEGDPHLNKSYYAWGRTIRAVADGVVVDICDHERDNPGYRGSFTQCYNNRVVIKHPGGYYSAYLHIMKGSRVGRLIEGSRVRAGQPIAQVGNSGNSSEPHLHFQVFRIDDTGRIQGIPVTFTNASHDTQGRKPVRGVALSGETYFFGRK